jgi:hypothetical protein
MLHGRYNILEFVFADSNACNHIPIALNLKYLQLFKSPPYLERHGPWG